MEIGRQSQPSLALTTVCDENFVNQAMAMMKSVEEHSSLNLQWYVLALTDTAFDLLNKRRRANWNLLSVPEIDQEFLMLRSVRPWREFCWTAASVLLNYVSNVSNAKYIGYVDSDCFFFRDITDYIEDLGKASVLIIPHDFSPDREEWRYKSGEYNVGVILGKIDQNFRNCIGEWRKQVLEECVVDPTLGKCGDQTYLNDWPKTFGFVTVLGRKGSALGPWNLNNFSIIDEDFRIDGKPIHFYHFHGFVTCRVTKFFYMSLSSPGYEHFIIGKELVYRKYLLSIIGISNSLNIPIRSKAFWPFILICIRARQIPSFLFRRHFNV